ncbi:enolase-phosphatase E1-like isoform X2 [Vespa mandarinia]|uniref:enolase-phosphatase E1-like isoform X2 n=1 Tax=Vespa mandarinia TaxID=7446 RepID=UPI00160D5027|nr:enolase-phosphatase E1-like isoform X2 [Vespa mandarinia]
MLALNCFITISSFREFLHSLLLLFQDTLFPYVRENLKKYIDTNWDDDKFKQDYHKLKEQAKKDEEDKVEGFIPITDSNPEEEKESLMKNILWQMDNDRKTGALKQLQGHMWQEAYKTTAIKGHVYEDVPKALESWMNDGKKIYVYSSGSVEAQKLLFGNSEQGDLLKYFSGFFDTEIGAKQECDSYKNILSKIGEKPDNVIFLTDIVREAAAAKEAGLLSVIVIREGNATLTDEETVAYMTIKSLLDLTFQTSTKRQKLNPTEPEEKNESVNPKSGEPMDTSEDVEMSDASGKKNEKTEITKSPQPEQEIKAQAEEKDQISSKKDESTKDIKDIETVTNVKPDEKEASIAKQPETPTKVGVTSVEDDTMDVARNEPISKPTEDTKDTKSEIILQNETVKVVKDDKIRDENVSEKSVESTSEEKNETKVEVSTNKAVTSSSTTEKNNSETEETVTKTTQVSTKIENAPLPDATKNGDNIAKIDTDKPAVSTETELKDTKNDLKDQENNVTSEKSTEVETKSEKIEEESKKAQSEKENVEIKPSLPKVEKHTESAESIEQESSKESVKEETVSDEVKDKSTVESDKKKLNGTTQNGDDVPVSDENLHRNGLNEASSSEQLVLTSSEETPAQNGEPESSTDTSAESIKVKKVVDSAVADGAGEPDVVPPVVVAATS